MQELAIMEFQKPMLDKWPEISFESLEDIEIENNALRIFYKSFFVIFHLPEKATEAICKILTYEVN